MLIITITCTWISINGVYVTKRYSANLSAGYSLLDDKLTHGHPLQRIIFERVEVKDEYEEFADLTSLPVHTRASEVFVVPMQPKPVNKGVPAQSKKKEKKKVKTIDASASDELLISYIVQAEAGNTEDLDGCRLVCDVILNRVRSNKFPNTVREVIFQTGQFKTVNQIIVDGTHSTQTTYSGPKVNDKVKEAVRMELTGARLDTESLFFARSPITSTGVYQHGRHYFSR